MSHSSEKRWNELAAKVANISATLVEQLGYAEEQYQQMQEVYTYAGGTATDLAALLFKEEIEVAGSPFTPTQEQIDKAADAVAAMAAAHQLYEAANNIVVTQSDRMTVLRRMI